MRTLTTGQRARSRRLRGDQTEAEARLWSRLRGRQLAGAKFRRQVALGPFVVDFCCLEVGLIVEIDGGQHAERQEADASRSEQLAREGFRVLRIWNDEVLRDTEVVLGEISRAIEQCRGQGHRYGG